ncbi:MAG: hypothetical protein Kow00121_64950 [Elainellaceae cyanobacterium]
MRELAEQAAIERQQQEQAGQEIAALQSRLRKLGVNPNCLTKPQECEKLENLIKVKGFVGRSAPYKTLNHFNHSTFEHRVFDANEPSE